MAFDTHVCLFEDLNWLVMCQHGSLYDGGRNTICAGASIDEQRGEVSAFSVPNRVHSDVGELYVCMI